jgi:serine/threonine protein kinase
MVEKVFTSGFIKKNTIEKKGALFSMASPPIFCPTCGVVNQAEFSYCFSCGSPLRKDQQKEAEEEDRIELYRFNVVLKQHYALLRLIGRGGMGTVYEAMDMRHNQRVAVKEMLQRGLDPQQIARVSDAFQREAHLLSRLHHPGLPAIYDYFSENGRWYLVMDLIEGETLEQRLNYIPTRKLPRPEALTTGIQLCSILHYLHARPRPIIFWDLKPSNIMLTPQNMVYLIDFGIARHFSPGPPGESLDFGTAGYAAPELYTGQKVTPQADIYSLGVLLFRMLSGHEPSQASGHQEALPPPAELQNLISRMLAKQPQDRPSNTLEIRKELQHIRQGLDNT